MYPLPPVHLDRLTSKIEWPEEADECWLWTAALNEKGYGMFRSPSGRTVRAHRLIYEIMVGPIPEAMTIDHLCHVRHCLNPSHMEVVTQAENCLRGASPPALNARKTHCPKGHPYAGPNLYVNPNTGYRDCRTCQHAKYLRRKSLRSPVR